MEFPSLSKRTSDEVVCDCHGLSLVLPVLDEVETLPGFLSTLDNHILNEPWNPINEIVIVDDGSTDGSVGVLSDFKDSHPAVKFKMICRNQALGSANAEIVGCINSSNVWALKMDVDGQHSIELIRSFSMLMRPELDLVVASRYHPDGGNAWSPFRGVVSRSALLLSKILVPGARDIADPVSGFFMVRTELTRKLEPSLARYKMLLYLIARYPQLRAYEIPFVMRDRTAGASKIATTSLDFLPQYFIELLRYYRVSVSNGYGIFSRVQVRSRKVHKLSRTDSKVKG